MIYDLLYDWQKEIVDKNINRKSYALYLDCGLGKSPISLSFAEKHSCTKIIIISINSKAEEDENVSGSFFWWLTKSNIAYNLYNKKHAFDDTGAKKYRRTVSPETKDVLFLNYESLYSRSKDREQKVELKESLKVFLRNCKNQNVALIIDESHKMKSSNSLQTIAIKKIKQLLEIFTPNLYIYLLSGTPFTAGFEDLYTQLSMLGMPMNKGQFMENFCIRGNIPTLPFYAQPVVDYKNIDQLFRIVHHYGITMKTEEVIKLPEKIFVNHILPRSKEMRLFSNEKLKCDEINKEFELRASTERVINENGDGKVNNPFFRNIDYPNLAWLGDTAANAWLRARQLSIGFQGNEEEAKWFHRARLNEVEKLLEEKPDNYILFYEYVPEFIELYEICDKLGYKIDVYNGLIKSLVFYEQFEKLSEGQKLVDKKRIILANYKSGSTGKNFQEYSKCILFNVPLFSDFEQGIKRINRIGQDQKTIYHMFYEDNWLDRSMLKSLNKKIDYDKNMFEKDLKESQDEI